MLTSQISGRALHGREVACFILNAVAFMLAITHLNVDTRADNDILSQRGEDLVSALRSRSETALEGCLDGRYLRLVPATDIVRWMSRVNAHCGEIDQFILHRRIDACRAIALLRTTRGYLVPVALEIDGEPPHRIRHARFWDPCLHFRSRKDVKRAVADMGGSVGLYAAEISADGLRPWLDLNADVPLSVASAMKLYLLLSVSSDVTEGRRSWRDDLVLTDADRSMASGVMHRWPGGTVLSLEACAALMIGESDNTAADLILHAIGRSKVESSLSSWGHRDPARTIPYLSTAEMLRLKYHDAGTLGREYVRLPTVDRPKYLQDVIAKTVAGDVRISDKLVPTLVRDVGWFASAKDLAEALRHLWLLSDKKPDGVPLGILGISAPEGTPSALFDYAGAVMGRDGGVRAMACIVLDEGRWHVVTCVVNDARVDPGDVGVRDVMWGILCRGEGRLPE